MRPAVCPLQGIGIFSTPICQRASGACWESSTHFMSTVAGANEATKLHFHMNPWVDVGMEHDVYMFFIICTSQSLHHPSFEGVLFSTAPGVNA